MPTENTSLKKTAPAGDSTTTNEMVIGKINTYQRTFLIVGGSLLALLVWIAVAGTSGGQHLQSSAHETAEGAVALADYQVDTANDIFGLGALSGNDKVGGGCGCFCNGGSGCHCHGHCGCFSCSDPGFCDYNIPWCCDCGSVEPIVPSTEVPSF